MTGFPDPLTPPDCDLRGMPYMPVDLVRLFDSDLFALSSGDEFKVAFTLWGKAFLQVPAGSIPDDDRILAHLSGAGRLWMKYRSMALRGWIKCSDGRLYHPVVAAKARDAWEARMSQRSRTEAARAARAANRKASETPPAPSGTYPRVVSATSSVTETVAKDVTGSKGEGELSKKERKNPRPPTASAPKGGWTVAAPEWLPPEAWAEWNDYRRGRKWTARAANLAIAALERYRADGDDPVAVIHQSIASGYTGLFPLKRRSAPADDRNGMVQLLGEFRRAREAEDETDPPNNRLLN